jgi:hypothetical protein
MIDPVFLSTIIGDFSGITLEVCCEFDAIQGVMTQTSPGIALQVIIINLRDNPDIQAEIRCTITSEKLRVTCGPHSTTVGFTAHESEQLSYVLMKTREWLWNFFVDPEGVDKSEIPPPLVSPSKGFMWDVDDLLQKELISSLDHGHPVTLN